MKCSLAMLAFLALIVLVAADYDVQYVGGDFGRTWLLQHGGMPSAANTNNSLWNWGGMPKGYAILNGNPYPAIYGPAWYYPDFLTNSTPIVINSSAANNANYISSDLLPPNFIYEDPWILAQTTGRPVVIANSPPSKFMLK